MKGHGQIRRRKPSHGSANHRVRAPVETSELLLLPDGRVLLHNLTPAMARWLAELNPNDPQLAPRAASKTEHATRNTYPHA